MSDRRTWLAPIALFAIALVVRLVAMALVTSAPSEASAYYVDVAANLVSGRGLVSDAVWSYATPPLVVPKPAFELWLPMASLVSALPMTIIGTSFTAAQLGSALVGAFVAPITWAIGRETANASGLDGRRAAGVAIGSGLIVAVLGPLLVATAGPDSTTPFLVFGTFAAWLMPRALRATTAPTMTGRVLPGLALGVTLGLAYLSRQEAIWLAAAFLAFVARGVRARSRAIGGRSAIALLGAVVAGGLLVVVPWLVRDAIVFGTPVPGQALENAFLRRNEEIFAYLERPTLAGFLAQGPGPIVSHQLSAMWHNLMDVIVLPAFPVGVIGLVALPALRHDPALGRPTALAALLLSGCLTFLITGLVFPVATMWGTFQHASGPLLVGLTVCAALGADRLMARVSARRAWASPNVILAPIAMLAVAASLAGLQLVTLGRQTERQDAMMRAVASDLRGLARTMGGDVTDVGASSVGVVVSDHPMWLADALDGPVIVLPDEPPANVAQLAADFGARWLVVFDRRGRYPDLFLEQPRDACLGAEPRQIGPATDPAWLFLIDPTCLPT